MEEKIILQILNDVGAIRSGHFVFTSGLHSGTYINKDAVYPHTKCASLLCLQIAESFSGDAVEVVVAPAVGGIILSQWVAHHLTYMSGREVLGVYAEKETLAITDTEKLGGKCFIETGNFIIKRGYDQLIAGKNVLVVEDILTTGGSARKVVEAARAIGGNVVGLGALANRGGVTSADVASVPRMVSLININLVAWAEEDCPLCKEGVQIDIDVGKGREFLARKH